MLDAAAGQAVLEQAAYLIEFADDSPDPGPICIRLQVMKRGDTANLSSLSRLPKTGIERSDGVFDRLLKRWKIAFLLERRP